MDVKVEKALNEQIHAEFFSFYLYLSVSAYFSSQHLDGFAHWMRIQAQEEFGHAMDELLVRIHAAAGHPFNVAPPPPRTMWATRPCQPVGAGSHPARHPTDAPATTPTMTAAPRVERRMRPART